MCIAGLAFKCWEVQNIMSNNRATAMSLDFVHEEMAHNFESSLTNVIKTCFIHFGLVLS